MLAQEANDHEEREHYARLRDAWTKLAKGCEPFNFSDVTEKSAGRFSERTWEHTVPIIEIFGRQSVTISRSAPRANGLARAD
jgi:hypothetical protein